MDQKPPKKERTPAQLAAFEKCLAARNASILHKEAVLQPAPATPTAAPVPVPVESVPVEPVTTQAPVEAEEALAEEDEFLDSNLFLDEINATRREMVLLKAQLDELHGKHTEMDASFKMHNVKRVDSLNFV